MKSRSKLIFAALVVFGALLFLGAKNPNKRNVMFEEGQTYIISTYPEKITGVCLGSMGAAGWWTFQTAEGKIIDVNISAAYWVTGQK